MDKEMQQFQGNLMESVRDMKAGRAALTHRSQPFLGSDAIRRYVGLKSWQIAEIQQAITEADGDDFASDDEFNAVVAKYAG